MLDRRSLARLVGADDLDVDHVAKKYSEERSRRLRADANAQYERTDGRFSSYGSDPWGEAPTREPVADEVEVSVVGAGFSGLLAAARLRAGGLRRVRLIDTASDVGGTWYWNRYPGAQCDIESYVYLPLLEELGDIPREKYSHAPEILEHARRIADEYGLYEHALLGTQVTDLRWDEEVSTWIVGTSQGDRFSSRFVVIANGTLSNPKLPGVPGIDEFAGHAFHSSRWDYDYTGGDAAGNLAGLADKRVGIIGTGATALQIVPHVAASARHLFVFQRTPTVVAPRNNRPTDPAWSAQLEPGWQARRIQNFTDVLSGEDVDEDLVDDAWTEMFPRITARVARRVSRRLDRSLTRDEADSAILLSDMAKGHEIRQRVTAVVDDPKAAAALEPWYYVSCKRPGFHDEYLSTFNRTNVTLVETHGAGVERLTRTAAIVDGVGYDLNCLIFATGFEVGTSLPRRTGVDPVGRDGRTLSGSWRDGPRTLHGMLSPGFPNLFFMGIVQNGTTINFTHLADQQAQHIAHIVCTTRNRGANVIEVTEGGASEWLEEMRAQAPGTSRTQLCTPSYTNSEGDLANPHSLDNIRYGGGPRRYFAILRDWRANGGLAGTELR